MPTNTVVVARPSILGNPFVVTKEPTKHPTWAVHYVPNSRVDIGPGGFVDDFDSREEAIECAVNTYREWATGGRNRYLRVLFVIEAQKLRGKNLACWCPLDQPCHADVLLALANEVTR